MNTDKGNAEYMSMQTNKQTNKPGIKRTLLRLTKMEYANKIQINVWYRVTSVIILLKSLKS